MEWDQIQILKNITYHNTMLLQAKIEMEAMKAENRQREVKGESPAYGEKQFMSLIDKHGIHHNSVVSRMQESL